MKEELVQALISRESWTVFASIFLKIDEKFHTMAVSLACRQLLCLPMPRQYEGLIPWP